MIHLLWLLPTLAVAASIVSGRLNTTYAALLGVVMAIPIALLTAPTPFGSSELVHALARGLWIGVTIAPYILGGLLFWQVAMAGRGAVSADSQSANDQSALVSATLAERRSLFLACFLIGPFAEAATGFGVGMLATVALLRRLNLAPRHLMVFALLSQTIIPWGAMGSGTLLAAAYARMPASELGVHSMVLVTVLMLLVWLPLFWRTASASGMRASASECAHEAVWILVALGLLTIATAYLGPETALLAAFGPLIVLRYVIIERPERHQVVSMMRRVLPYMVLIGGLVLTRLLPGPKESLRAFGALAPFPDLPIWSPLFHAGSWLIVGGVLCALLRGEGALLGKEMRAAWKTGKHATMAVFLFAMMSEVMSIAGISRAFAEGMFAALDANALLLTPLVSGAFGVLANTGNAPNSLFMSPQLILASQAGMSISAVAALQHISGSSLSIFSPVRMSIAAALCQGYGQERAVYSTLLLYAIVAVALLTLTAIILVANS
ncbi:hypothetical protein B6S59_01345 [Pseudomonas sp. A46]|nr:L-lactate permease [Pseudomonas sp. A46]OWJ98248.1 hypothetical protein B6S59_01345 [Pseudomonas sp. A46]